MSDKLPEWVESWIDDNELFGVVDAQLIRAFLAQYVLCEREPVGFTVIGMEGSRPYRELPPAEQFSHIWTPLYAQAKRA